MIRQRKSGFRIHILYSESAVLDAIGIATDYCAKVCVICFGIVQVGSATVIAKNHILGGSILVWDEEICETRAVRYEACVDARRRDCILSENALTTRALSQSSEGKRRQSKKRGNHADQLFALQEAGFDNKQDVKGAWKIVLKGSCDPDLLFILDGMVHAPPITVMPELFNVCGVAPSPGTRLPPEYDEMMLESMSAAGLAVCLA